MEQKKAFISSIMYRKRRLNSKYDELRWLVSGTGTDFVRLLLTPKGKFSKSEINKMVAELTDCLEEYKSYRLASAKGAGAKMEKNCMSEDERTFYYSFFYVIIGMALNNEDGQPGGWFSKAGTWDAILERIESCELYRDESKLYRDIINHFAIYDVVGDDIPLRFPEGAYGSMYAIHNYLSDKPIIDLIPEAEAKKAYKLMENKEVALVKKALKDPSIIEKMARENEDFLNAAMDELIAKANNGEAVFDNPDSNPQEYMYAEEEYEAFVGYEGNAVSEDIHVTWAEYFGTHEDLEADIRRVLNNTVDMCKNHNLVEMATNALHLYLAKKGISSWADDERYFEVYTYMNKAYKACRSRFGGIL